MPINKEKINAALVSRLRKQRPDSNIDYSNVDFSGPKVPIELICKKHGPFTTLLSNYINRITGCKHCHTRCSDHDVKERTRKFIIKANAIHGRKYKYSKVNFVNRHEPITIICPDHGEFTQPPEVHLKGIGCFSCGVIQAQITKFKNPMNKYRFKEYQLGKHTVLVQGYEPQALDYVQKKLKVKANQIKTGKDVPVIEYYDKKKKCSRQYFPDFYIPNDNRVVEVKSNYTMEVGFKELKCKRKAAIKAGYLFSLLVMDKDGKRIKVPDNWHTYKTPELLFP